MFYIWFLSVAIFFFYLIAESILLNKQRESIPLRITVTGIRGKTSVVRLLASVLRYDEKNVVAKTTGAKPCLIYQDGTEEVLKRRGLPSILEQKKLIKTAHKVNADVIVSEIMSIHPENHYIESQKILKPHIVAITNFRLDHTEAMGKTKENIAEVFCSDIPQKTTVFIPEKEKNSVILNCLKEKNCKNIEVKDNISKSCMTNIKKTPHHVFPADLDTVYSICNHLNIDKKVIEKGVINVSTDSGSLKIWEYRNNNKNLFLINGFGANDPESTLKTISKIKNILPADQKKITGLLCLRKDRGDRTLQWISFLKNNQDQIFDSLFVTGGHSKYVERKLKQVTLIKTKKPEEITEKICSHLKNQSVLLGFGNFKKTGNKLVNYWEKIGKKYY
ncbi:MAG: poly-gamma-glutamate synthase PgsB [bacterium]